MSKEIFMTEGLAEAFFRGIVQAFVFTLFFIILFLGKKIFLYIKVGLYQLIYKKPYWTKKREENNKLVKERDGLLRGKDKIIKESIERIIEDRSLDTNKNYQEYYKIEKEENEIFKNKIVEIEKKIKEINLPF